MSATDYGEYWLGRDPDPGGRRGVQFVTGTHLSHCRYLVHAGQPPKVQGSPPPLPGEARRVACRPRVIVVRQHFCFTSRICLYSGYNKHAPALFPMCCSSIVCNTPALFYSSQYSISSRVCLSAWNAPRAHVTTTLAPKVGFNRERERHRDSSATRASGERHSALSLRR
jgi:hypothetical protein